jgi:hypothetical protein
MEFQIVVSEILRRLPDYQIGDGADPYPSIGIVNGWVGLPVTFRPGAREAPKFTP